VAISLIVGLAFAAGCLAIFAINLVLIDIAEKDRKLARVHIAEQMRERSVRDVQNSLLFRQDLSKLAEEAFEEASAPRRSFYHWVRELTEQSGMRITPRHLMIWSASMSFTIGALALLISRHWVGAVAAAATGAVLPILYVQIKRQKRLELLREQLPDCFELMSRIIRAGQTVSQAMHAITEEFKAPAATEFGYCYDQQNLGLPPELAYRELARRTGLLEIKIFVLALLVNRQTGGNMTGLLENLSTIVRERFRTRGKIKGLTAEGRMQALILLLLPFLVYFMLFIINREYALKLFDLPALLFAAIALMAMGGLWIRKIVNFDF
jgi:tight adherence protein B